MDSNKQSNKTCFLYPFTTIISHVALTSGGHVYLHSSLVKLKLCNTVRVCSLLGLKQLPHAGKSPWQGTDRRLFRDLMKQEISLAASTSA